jgi:hypothetical protein
MLLDPIPDVGGIWNQSHATSCAVADIRLSERIERTET